MSTQNETVTVDGQPVSIDTTTTVAELKEAVGASKNDVATYLDRSGEVVALSDHDAIGRAVPEGANISFQPAHGTVFG